ncbi:MAG TPA: putative lipid II flippase FtsW [Acidimicrobiales bacterium]
MPHRDDRRPSGGVAVAPRPNGGARTRHPSAAANRTAGPGPAARRADRPAVATTGARRRSVAVAQPSPAANQGYVLLLGLIALLTLIGLVMVLSASSDQAILHGGSPWTYFEKQVMWVTIGTGALACFTLVDYRRWRRWSLPLLALVMFLLVAVCVPHIGVVVNGSRRWLGVGSLQFQPSEIAKLGLILFAADLLARRADRMHDTRFTFRPVAGVVFVMAALVMYQPDMGTTIVICAIAAAILFVAGTPARTLALAGGVAGACAGVMGIVAPYRLHRLLSFLHPQKDAGNTGYQAVQARYGMAAGHLFGVGLGAGREKTGYLPNAHTDFIFAVIGEEVGLVGCLVVVSLFVALAVLGVRAAVRAPDRFGTLLATGITAWILVQAIVNIGAVVGLLPVTGVPLPFVSFGGSSMVITMAGVGILANVARQGR